MARQAANNIEIPNLVRKSPKGGGPGSRRAPELMPRLSVACGHFDRNPISAKVRHMSRSSLIRRTLTFLLTTSVILASLAPASAAVAASGEEHVAHVAHGGDHGADGSSRCDQNMKTCTQHDSCVGQCGACCAHCFGAVFFALPLSVHAHPVQTPVLSQLHSFVLIASRDRPPRILAL